jgi:hypothetical protein
MYLLCVCWLFLQGILPSCQRPNNIRSSPKLTGEAPSACTVEALLPPEVSGVTSLSAATQTPAAARPVVPWSLYKSAGPFTAGAPVASKAGSPDPGTADQTDATLCSACRWVGEQAEGVLCTCARPQRRARRFATTASAQHL